MLPPDIYNAQVHLPHYLVSQIAELLLLKNSYRIITGKHISIF